MNTDKRIFDEKQYMGHNRLSIIWRTVIALFCFVGYYWSENPKPVQVAIFKIGHYPALDIPNSGKIFFFSFDEKVCLVAFKNPGVKAVFLI